MGNTKTYQYYQLEAKHFQDVQYIFRKGFNKKVSIDYLTRKYDTSYIGINSVATIAYDKQKPIAFYGAIPQIFQNKGRPFLIAQVCDLQTLPKYQKQGIHYHLALKSYELMRVCGIKMVYSFHSENSYFSTKKLNWKEHISMKRFHIHTGALPIAKIYNKLNLNPLLLKKATRLLKPYTVNATNNPLAKENRIHQQYTKSFFNYKEGFNQHYAVTINTCTFYLKLGAIMQVGYVDYQSIDSLNTAIKKLTLLAKLIGISEILFQVDPTTKQYEGLSSITKGLSSWLIGYLLFDEQLDITQFGFNHADLDTF